MRRVLGLATGLLTKLNNPWTYRVLAVSLVAVTGVGGVYLGVQRFGRKKDAPTKKVVTGVGDGATAESVAAATLAPPTTLAPSSESSLSPTASSDSGYGGYGQYGYDSSAASPPVNPYREAVSDVAHSTAEVAQPPSNPYGYGSYADEPATPSYDAAEESAPTTVQVAGAESANLPPDNPYAVATEAVADPVDTGDANAIAIPPSTSAPLAGNPPPANPYEAQPLAPAQSDPIDAYADRYAGAGDAAGADGNVAVAEPPSSTVPPNTLQPLDASPSPLGTQPGLSQPSLSQPVEAPPSSLTPGTLGGPSSVAGEGVGTPGDRHLEGLQAPSITIEKLAPPEIQVGKQATFELRVRNVGQTPATNVVVTDQVPRGTTLVDARPEYTRSADGGLAWNLGTLQPGAEVALQMQLMPQTEGEVGSVAQVTFAAQATSRSVCTRPLVTVEHTAPPKVMIGQPLTLQITVSNPGTGVATGVVIEEDVPEGLVHAAGTELEYEVGVLRPGESKRLDLALKAEKPGIIENTIVVRGDANLSASHRVQIEVVAPQLQVDVNGPKKRFLQRQATYTVSVANPGTAAARDVELVAFLPRGMKFVETDSQGQYDPRQHAVFWSLEELPAAKEGNVTLVTIPVEAGEQRLRVEGKADLGLSTANEQIVQVDAAAELRHTVTDLSDPIEVGSETVYEIRVSNAGTKTATNVRLMATLPAEMKLISGDGPTRGAVAGQRIDFEPLARLNPQEEAVYKVHVQGLQPGDHLIRVQLASDEWPTPVSREESTRVYEDR